MNKLFKPATNKFFLQVFNFVLKKSLGGVTCVKNKFKTIRIKFDAMTRFRQSE